MRDHKVQHVTTLHPDTVAKIGAASDVRNTDLLPKQKRKYVRRNGPVAVTRLLTLKDVNPLLKVKVLQLAGNDESRLMIVSPTEVVVLNNGVSSLAEYVNRHKP